MQYGGCGPRIGDDLTNSFVQAQELLGQLEKGDRFVSPAIRVVRKNIMGEEMFFAINAPDDVIQRFHIRGRFFEETELSYIQKFMPMGGVFVDIGANIGNHALFVAKHLRAKKVIPFEPNHVAINLLLTNIWLNQLEKQFDFKHLGYGLSDQRVGGLSAVTPQQNLGATHLEQSDGGTIVAEQGDRLLAGEEIDLIKIDVEGMEITVLNGLERTVAGQKPNILIEVDHGNRAEFDTWCGDLGYRRAVTFKKYRDNQNFMIVPDNGSGNNQRN